MYDNIYKGEFTEQYDVEKYLDLKLNDDCFVIYAFKDILDDTLTYILICTEDNRIVEITSKEEKHYCRYVTVQQIEENLKNNMFGKCKKYKNDLYRGDIGVILESLKKLN